MIVAPDPPRIPLAARLAGLALAVGVAAIGLIAGFMQGLPAQQVILYAVATLAICAWAWRFIAGQLIAAPAPDTESQEHERE